MSWLAFKVSPAVKNRKLMITIPKRTVPLSVRRSRLKRLIREAVRRLACAPPENAAFHFIIKKAPPEPKLSDVLPLVRDMIRGSHG